MNEIDFKKSLARAQQLILSEEFNRKVEAKANMNNGKRPNGGDLNLLEQQAFGYSPSAPQQQYEILEEPNTQRGIEDTNLPNAIKESFRKQPAMTSGMDMVMPPASYAQPKNILQERENQTIQATGGIDYSLIKTIVEECFRQHEKKQINEGIVKGFKIGNGNKIQFVDNKGNLYEGTLTLKKKSQK